MNKLWTIVQREYLVRVTSKSFILATILTPLGIAALMFASIWLSAFNKGKAEKVLILDESEITGHSITDTDVLDIEYTNETLENARAKYDSDDYSIFIHIPSSVDSASNEIQATYESKEKIGINKISSLELLLSDGVRMQRIGNSNIDEKLLESFEVQVNVENADYLKGDKVNSTGKIKTILGTILGGIMGLLMYMVIFIYGAMVMRSVMEEKVNRIVEVMISSVKPFHLMLGKVIGVGIVGLSQLLFWIILIPILLFIVSLFLGESLDPNMDMTGANMSSGIPADQMAEIDMASLLMEFQSLNWVLIIPVFILFFLGGYFIYASFYAAIGSAIGDDMGESQSLVLPIMVPVIIGFMMLVPILEDPHGKLAIFGSLFPLLSPILMPARLAFDPPLWQITLSLLILIVSTILSIWVTARIYRVGILMYGKKVNFKDMVKWFFYKG